MADGSSPSNLYVSDDQGLYSCARALYKDQYQDFDLGSSLDVTGWWVDGDPLHVTIVPFNIGSGSCDSGSDVDFDASRALAVWLSPYKGQEQDPGDAGSIYCDLSKNPDDCECTPFKSLKPICHYCYWFLTRLYFANHKASTCHTGILKGTN